MAPPVGRSRWSPHVDCPCCQYVAIQYSDFLAFALHLWVDDAAHAPRWRSLESCSTFPRHDCAIQIGRGSLVLFCHAKSPSKGTSADQLVGQGSLMPPMIGARMQYYLRRVAYDYACLEPQWFCGEQRISTRGCSTEPGKRLRVFRQILSSNPNSLVATNQTAKGYLLTIKSAPAKRHGGCVGLLLREFAECTKRCPTTADSRLSLLPPRNAHS